MRILLYVSAAFCLFIPASVFAGEVPKAEVFGGYALLHTTSPSQNINGWNASVTGNLTDWFGVAGDFGGHYASPEVHIFSIPIPTGLERSTHSFLFGPRFVYRGADRLEPFAHLLFGGSRSSVGLFGLSVNKAAFTAAAGGGLDIRLSDAVAIRAIQADYLMTHFGGERQNNARLSFGVVFRFGK